MACASTRGSGQLLFKQRMTMCSGPFLAKLSDLWLAYQSRKGCRSLSVHQMHQRYGPCVRIAPNHLSVADPDALPVVYGHATGTLKSPFYDAFVSPLLPRGLFNTRDRTEHSRKRKLVSHVFATAHIKEFERS
jgi:benzoate 4-monooxygenase